MKGLGVIVMQFGRLWYILYMSCAALPAGPGLPSGHASVYTYGGGTCVELEYMELEYTELTVLGALLQKQITLCV